MKTLLCLFLLPALLIGCARRSLPAYDYAEAPEETYSYEDDFDEEEPVLRFDAASGPAAPEPAAEPPPAELAPQDRRVHYSGWLSLLATDPEQVVADVVTSAEGAGGYVERRTLTEVTVRVPAERFSDVWSAALALGDVLDKSLTAEDVTDAYLALTLRLETARATRARLQELLAASTDEAEVLSLLREIQRLTELIDRLEGRSRTLSQLASFSRITVQASPRQAYALGAERPELDGFQWIRQLSPFRRDLAEGGRPLDLAVPEGMVALDTGRHFVAESADGAVMWSGRIPNDPKGDTGYWAAAVRERLGPEFGGAELSQVGDFAVLRLLEPGADSPYRYLVAVRAAGRWLDLVEVYYPGPDQEDRYGEGVRASLLAAGGAS